MRKENNIFSEDIEIPDIVMQKAEAAFQKIRQEEGKPMIYHKKRNVFGKQAAIITGVCVLMLGSISAVAAIQHNWGRGMQGGIQATKEQQQILTQQGVATVLSEEKNLEDMAVTCGNVTVAPETVIVDEGFAFVSFSVKGYVLGEGVEPGFEFVNTYLGDNEEDESGRVNMSASFYGGIIADETGGLIYEDGSPLAFTENGELLSRYVDEEGNLEYVVQIAVANQEDSLLGQTLHVDFKNLGTLYKAEYTGALEGEWNFTVDLPKVSQAIDFSIGKEVPGTNFVLDSARISPISIKVNYSVNGEVSIHEDENGVPDFCGVILKDGTKLPYISNGGITGYTDETMTSAYVLSTFDRVLEVEQIKSILVRTEAGEDMVEIPIE